MLRIDTNLYNSMTSCLVFSGSLSSTRLLSVAQGLQTFKRLEPVSSFRLRRQPCAELTEIESTEALQKFGMAAQAAMNQERGMAFEMTFLPNVLSFEKRLEQGTRSTLSLKKRKSRGKVEGSQKIETNLSIYINPALRAPHLPASSINVWGSRAPYGKLLFRLGDVKFSLQRELVKGTIRWLWKELGVQIQLIKM